MITIEPGRAVDALLSRVMARPWMYSNVTLCAPYVDDDTLNRVIELAMLARRTACGVTLITSPARADLIRRTDSPAVRAHLKLLARPGLHSKAYFLLGRKDYARSEALVTSANLTATAMKTNHELGVHIRGTSPTGLLLLHQVHRFLNLLLPH